jgi:hypothetical protein
LASGGSIDNASSAALIENLSGIAIYAAATATGVSVVNAGSILGNPTTGIGVELLGGGNVSNASGGTITAGNFGVALSGGVVTNQGAITSSSKTGPAVLLNTSVATVSNQSGGRISGEGGGIYGTGAADTVVNAGRVQASSANGIALVTGGTITNQSGGTITGSAGGIYVRDGAGLRFGARAARGFEQRRRGKVALRGRRWTDGDRFIGLFDMQRMPVRLRVDSHRSDALSAQRADNAAGDGAAVCDEYFTKHPRLEPRPASGYTRYMGYSTAGSC